MVKKRDRLRYALRRANRSKATEDAAIAAADPAIMDADAFRLAADLDRRVTTAALTAARADLLPRPVAAKLLLALQRVQYQRLLQFTTELSRRSKFLSAPECWKYLQDRLSDAQRFGIEAELRELVYRNAGEFSDSRMLKQVRCHSKYAT